MNKGREEKFRFSMHYPWRTLCAAVLLGSYALLLLSPALQQRLALPAGWWQPEYLQGAFLVWLLVAWFELVRFRQQQQKLRASLQQLWLNKRELQLKAQTSASHTDKLKLFISDKLLEYIEYDEKFLHFKSIASEVRHNGVISFDKVQSALLYARDHSLPDEQGTQATLYQEALVGMRYLWDLLDLSTTDNMALHIGDHIAACEEQVFAAELQGINAEELPQAPLFDPRQALVDSLTLHLGLELLQRCDHDDSGCPDSAEPQVLWQTGFDANPGAPLFLQDNNGHFRVDIFPCEVLLGNANHFVLLLENLLRNAQFFAGKRQYKSPFPGVSVSLKEQQHYLDLSIYNRGPHISPQQQAQMFQLGYSTRRVKEHNGKGLGLYFVQQIVQGFDGVVVPHNIDNQACQYHLRLQLADGEIRHISLHQQLENGLPLIRADDCAAQKQWQLVLDKALVSIEVSQPATDGVSRLEVNNSFRSWFDPQHPGRPQWQITLSGRKQDKLGFIALDIRGVEFNLRMPTLTGRMDGIPALDDGPDVDKLGEHFQAPDDF